MESEMTEQTNEAPQPTAPQAAPAQTTTADDLASLLSEFETQTAKQPTPPAAQSPEATPQPSDPAALNGALAQAQAAFIEAQKNGTATDMMRSQLDTVTNGMQGLYQHFRTMQDRSDFDKLVSDASKMLKDEGVAVTGDFARRWLIAESQLDPQLVAAFDHRYESPQHQRAANKLIDKAMRRLVSAAKKEPDATATADRYAVAAAVRGTSTKAPPEKPVKYGDMSDAEFAKEKAKYGL